LVCLIPDRHRESGRAGTPASCQEETHALQQVASLFDHLVALTNQRRRCLEAKRLGVLV
jgi:hypothetical protein